MKIWMGAPSCTLWITGLPRSGKLTISRPSETRLHNLVFGVNIFDEVRRNFGPKLSLTKKVKEIHLMGVVHVGKLISRNDVISTVSHTSSYGEFQQYFRESIGIDFIEVWVKALSKICRNQDFGELHKKAKESKISNMTSIQFLHEQPLNPELILEIEWKA